jgi:hypothetical protein
LAEIEVIALVCIKQPIVNTGFYAGVRGGLGFFGYSSQVLLKRRIANTDTSFMGLSPKTPSGRRWMSNTMPETGRAYFGHECCSSSFHGIGASFLVKYKK